MIKKADQAGTELPTELRTALAKAKMPNGETAYVELSLEGQRRLTTAVGTNVQILPDDVVARHRDEKDIKWMSLNRLMRLKTEERKEADFLDRLSTASAPEVIVFAKWVLEQAPAHDLTIVWGDAGPLLKYEDADAGHSFTLGQLSWRGRLSSTQRFSRRIQRLGLDASIYQGYLDQVAALIPGATRRRFRAPSGKEWEQLATSDSPNKGIPRLDPLVTHGPEWFAIIDATVRKIRAALENRDDSADEGGIDLKKDDERSEATPKEYWECEVDGGNIRTAEAGVAALRASAAQGDADAQFNLGVMYAEGYGVPQDYVEAGTWYRLAAERGDPEAQTNLGVMYADGRGVPQNDVEAVVWHRLAAEQGHANAQNNLGVSCATGNGVQQDAAEAVAWHRQAAEQGHAEAQFNLGVSYATGEGVPQDNVEALMWHILADFRSTGKARERTEPARNGVAAQMTPADRSEANRRAREWHEAHPVP